MRTPSRKIPLSQGYSAIIDAADFDLISQHSWHAQLTRSTPYAVTRLKGSRKSVALHRLLTGAQMGQNVRFSNRNTLDCRRKNLEIPNSTSDSQVA